MNPPANPLMRLLGSSKALVMLAITGACFIALFLGKSDWVQTTDFLKWIVGPWLISAGLEDAGQKYGQAKAASIPPPAGQ